ncbi:putative ankyrin repeat-containing domain-containing protein [Plasmopara halstedii]
MHATIHSTQSGGSPVTEDEKSMSPFSSSFSSSTNGASFVQLLQHAAQIGDVKQITKLIQTTRPSVSSSSSSVNIPKNDLSLNSWLDAADEDGFTALHFACIGGHGAVVQELLLAGANTECATSEGFTALMFAARTGSLSIVQTLVSLDANIMACDVDGNNAAVIAELNEHAMVAKFLQQQMLLLENLSNKSPSLSSSNKCEEEKDHRPLSFQNFPACSSEFLLGEDCGLNTKSSEDSSTCSSPQQLVGNFYSNDDVITTRNADGATPLHVAAMHGQLETVKVLLARGARLSAALPSGTNGLHLASASGFVDVASFLIDQGLPVDGPTKYGYTPLHEAAYKGHVEVAKLLLKCGANVNAATVHGTTPLHRAAENGHVQIAELLIAHGAHIDATTSNFFATTGESKTVGLNTRRRQHQRRTKVVEVENEGKSDFNEVHAEEPRTMDELEKALSACRSHLVALCQAAKNDRLDIVQYILARGTIGTEDLVLLEPSKHPLILAAQRGHLEIVRCLLAYDACTSSLPDAASCILCRAAEHGYLQMVEHALLRGANVEAVGGKIQATPLVLASRRGNLAVVLHLLWSGAKIDAAAASTGYTALHYASKHGHLTVVNALLLNGANVDAVCVQRRSSPLHLAVESGYQDVVRCLLSFNASVDAEKHPSTMTALHIAAERGHSDVVRELLTHNARLEAPAQNNLRALFIAAYCGHKDVVELLLDHGAELEALSGTNEATPLRGAVSKGHTDVVQLLLARGADANATQVTDGTTSLHSAAANDFGYIIKILVAAGADPDREDRQGRTPIRYATSDVVRLKLRLALLKSQWQRQDGGRGQEF